MAASSGVAPPPPSSGKLSAARLDLGLGFLPAGEQLTGSIQWLPLQPVTFRKDVAGWCLFRSPEVRVTLRARMRDGAVH